LRALGAPAGRVLDLLVFLEAAVAVSLDDGVVDEDIGSAVVGAALRKAGSLRIRIRDELGSWYEDGNFAAVYPVRGAPGISPAQLAMVTVLQFCENLADRQAADEARGRVDWKYCLSLELADEGFEFTTLNGVPGPAMSPRTCWCPAGCGASPRSARAGPYLRPGPGLLLHRGHVHHRLGPPPGHLPLGAVSSKFLSG